MDWPLVRDITLFGLAIYGALLSTFNLLSARRRDQRSILVSLTWAYPTYGSTIGGALLLLKATNAGQRQVTITHLSIRVAGVGKNLWPLHDGRFPDTSLPAALPDGGEAVAYFPAQEVGRTLKGLHSSRKFKLIPVATDSTGTEHVGAVVKRTADELMDAAR